MYDEFGKIAWVAAIIIVAGIVLYNFTIYVLPWLILAAAVVGIIWFFFWYQSQKRSEHPWS